MSQPEIKESMVADVAGAVENLQIQSEEKEVYEDITEFLKEATYALKLGQLIHPPDFHLAEAMSCLEIMDPKMDSGMQLQKSPTFTAIEAKKSGLLIDDSLLNIGQLILLFDTMFQSEISFYQGNNILQSIFTCLYLHDISDIKNPILLSFSKILLKTCSVIRDLVLSTSFYEEEDFNGVLCGFHLLDAINKQEILHSVSIQEEILTKKISKVKNKGKKDMPDVEPLQEDESKELEFCEAILARLQFRKAFLNAQIYFDKGLTGLELAKKYTIQAQNQLQLIIDSHNKLVQENVEVPSCIFEAGITRRILATAPPNTIPLPTFDTAIEFIKIYLNDCLNFITWANQCSELPVLLDTIHRFSALDRNVISRARLFKLVFMQDKIFGKYQMSELVGGDMKKYGINPAEITAPLSKGLIDHLSHILILFTHNLFYNRSRQRRKIHGTFQDWGNLQEHSEMLDLKLHQEIMGELPIVNKQGKNAIEPVRLMFTNYIAEHTLGLMTHFIKLGFELELYSEFETSIVLWYLEFLYGRWSVVKASNMQFLFNQKVKSAQQAKATAKNAGKKKKSVVKVKNIDPPAPTIEHTLVEAHQSLSRAIVRFVAAIQKREGISAPEFPFGSLNLRFLQRFHGFQNLRLPTALSYVHFQESLKLNESVEQILKHSVEVLDISKLCLDRALKAATHPDDITELKKLIKVVISNKINILRLGPGSKIKYNFSIHPCYPVISVA